MQAARAANRICFAITHPKSKCDVPPNHGLTCAASLPNLVTTGRNLGQIRPSWPEQQEPISTAGTAGSVAIP